MARRAIVAGGSGLIGSELIRQLLQHPEYSSVVALVRSPLPLQHPKLEQVVVSFDRLRDFKEQINGDVLFCCLGSTRKKTPKIEDYRKVDYEYPLRLAELASENGVAQFHLISALGADPSAGNFYSRLKGETELAVRNIAFSSLHIYRPSLLTGDRKENRPGERLAISVMKVLNPLLGGSLRKYRSIKASTVASAMINQSLKNLKGSSIYPSDVIQTLA